MSTGEAIGRLCLHAAIFAFGASEIRKELNKQKKLDAKLEKRKMMKARSKAGQRRAILDEDWYEDW